jgi:hypothetical protein
VVKVWVHRKFKAGIVKHLNLPDGEEDSTPHRFVFPADESKINETHTRNHTLSVCKQPHTVALFTLLRVLAAAGVDEVRVQCYAQKEAG